MKFLLKSILAAAVLAAGAAAIPAYAGSHVHFGVGFGFPVYPAPYYYPPPAYYYPPPVYVQPAPAPVYIEPPQAAAPPAPAPQAQAAPQGDQYWYYCPDSKTYYPYVKSCSSAWQRVRPQPPGT
ncbi:MAG TPA: hypothetical protein VHP37_18510 [Burkholderiales bacterium]|nr:hypothetical protein [Burkholderiales bacterium]